MPEKLFRCLELRDVFLLFNDLNILDPDFPEFIKMMQIGGLEHYELHQASGLKCSITGENIYEKDIIKYKGSIYRVVYVTPEFLLELIIGNGDEIIYEDDCEKIGTEWDPWSLISKKSS